MGLLARLLRGVPPVEGFVRVWLSALLLPLSSSASSILLLSLSSFGFGGNLKF